MTDDFAGAHWISRPVDPSTRILRRIDATRVDLAAPGTVLGQSFRSEGPVTAVNVDLAGPEGSANPWLEDVDYTLALETPTGRTVAERRFTGPQLVWDYFGPLLEVVPPAPPGEYVVVLRPVRGTLGWSTSDVVRPPAEDDGVSPLPVVGSATRDGEVVEGVRLLGVETVPAPNPVFRRRFDLDEVPEEAELAATVLGTGVLFVNGARVGTEVLEPAVTDYDRTVLYRTWDVAHLLRAGRNEIRIEAGRERYSARGGDVWGWNLAPWHREPVALARLTWTDAAGTARSIATGDEWEAAPGSVDAERLFGGEDHVVGAAEPAWTTARIVSAPRGVLRRADAPPVRAGALLAPIVSEELADGRIVHDFGALLVGRARCRIAGAAGSVVRVRSGEQRDESGGVVCDNTLAAGDAQLDTLRLESDVDTFEWEPSFSYRGFRWVQIETVGDVVVDFVRAVPLVADVETVGSLSVGDPLLEWIDAATARTFRNNLHGIPTDTPIYEKNGWTADAHLATEGLLHHLDLRSSFGKWMQDHIDAQGEDGAVPQIVPTPGWGRAADPAWSASAVLIPWYLYREYGDLEALARTAPMIRRFADHLVDALEDGIWRRRTWGDWLSPGHMVGPEGMPPIGTMMTVTVLQHTALVLRALGEGGADGYERSARFVAQRYHEEYFDPRIGSYAVDGAGYRQVLNILPLAFDVVPARHIDEVRAGLIADLEGRTAGHLDCGAVGVRHLLPVLSAAGRDDLALTVLTRRDRPAWGAWFEDGETTLLESWDVDARSRNHYFLGSVSAWIQQRVGGLRVTEPGWRRFEIAPVDDPRVDWASIRHRTPLGDAAVAWQRGPGGWRFEVTVPEGSGARIVVPGAERVLTPGTHLVRLTS